MMNWNTGLVLAEIGGAPYYPGAAVLALLLVLAHLAAPRLRRRLGPHATVVGSLGGGMAAAYVFLHLIPELEKGHELFGAMIFVVPLVGFAAHYVVQHRFRAQEEEDPDRMTVGLTFKLINLCVYNWLIVYGTPALGLESGWWATTIVIALLLHLIHQDYSFGREYPGPFDSAGRYFLALAAVAGYAAIALEQRSDEALSDIFTAFLAGSVLYNVFREEIPDDRESRIGWFLGGIALFSVLAALSG